MDSQIYQTLSISRIKSIPLDTCSNQQCSIRAQKYKEESRIYQFTIETLKAQIYELKKTILQQRKKIQYVSKKSIGFVVKVIDQEKIIEELNAEIRKYVIKQPQEIQIIKQKQEQDKEKEQRKFATPKKQADRHSLDIIGRILQEDHHHQAVVHSLHENNYNECIEAEEQQKIIQKLRNLRYGVKFQDDQMADLLNLSRKKTSEFIIEEVIEAHLLNYIIEETNKIRQKKGNSPTKSTLEKKQKLFLDQSLLLQKTRLTSIIQNFNFLYSEKQQEKIQTKLKQTPKIQVPKKQKNVGWIPNLWKKNDNNKKI